MANEQIENYRPIAIMYNFIEIFEIVVLLEGAQLRQILFLLLSFYGMHWKINVRLTFIPSCQKHSAFTSKIRIFWVFGYLISLLSSYLDNRSRSLKSLVFPRVRCWALYCLIYILRISWRL